MKTEIKEILDELKRSVNEDDWFEIDEINGKRLLDYITNLQESEAYYYGYYKDYKSRIDKAIEYIKSYKNDYAPYELSDYNIRELLNILNGGSNE